jgi:drug/metabolite transporter (DMT)-like permease
MKTLFWFALCICGWGLGAFLMAHLGRRLGLGTILVYNLMGYAIAIALLARNASLGWTWNHLLAVLTAIFFVLANYGFYRLSHGGEEVTILAPLSSLYVLVPVGLGVLLWQEPITPRKGLGILLGVLAMILLSWERQQPADSAGAHQPAAAEATDLPHSPTENREPR